MVAKLLLSAISVVAAVQLPSLAVVKCAQWPRAPILMQIQSPQNGVAPKEATYDDYMKERENNGGAPEGTQETAAAFGASSVLIDPELVAVAQQAVQDTESQQYMASEIVIAFNAWKLAQGMSYSDTSEEGLALRAFAADGELVGHYMRAAESALFTDMAYPDEDMGLIVNDVWHRKYDYACEERAKAEKLRTQASAAITAAEEKFRQTMEITSKHEQTARALAQRDADQALKRAEEHASAERSRLARELALLNAEEKDERALAEKQLRESIDALQGSSAKAIASAQADRAGALHKWKGVASQAQAAIAAAEADMAKALIEAREQAESAKAAAEKRAQSTMAAQAEAKALLELLRQTKQESVDISSKYVAEKRELEAAVDAANKRARKAKLAAAAALDDL